MILLDSSGLYAALVETERSHLAAKAALESSRPPFALSPFVLAEVDYLLTRTFGVATGLDFLREVASGAYELAPFQEDDVGRAVGVIEQYRDLGIGLADASLVVLAARLATDRLLTLDERHFRALRTSRGRPFVLLPADA